MSTKFTILGCGYSLGVPNISGNFGRCNPNNLKMGKPIKRINKNNSITINNQNNTVLAVGFNHKKYSMKRVNRKYKTPNVMNNILPLISSFV